VDDEAFARGAIAAIDLDAAPRATIMSARAWRGSHQLGAIRYHARDHAAERGSSRTFPQSFPQNL
jgi:hypothetical protein